MARGIAVRVRGAVTTGVMMIAERNRRRRAAPAGDHPFLSGIHAPLAAEVTLTDLAVTGAIPPELNGRYLRNGPNPLAPNPAAHHWFLGDGMIHGIRLEAGRAAWYRNRWVRTRAVSAALGEAPPPGPADPLSDVVNTNVIGHAGQTWAIVEAGPFPVRLGEHLETIAHDPFGGTLHHAFSAHPHTDPATGEMHAVCYRGDEQNAVWYVIVGADGRVRREVPIPVRHGPMIHDCMITARHAIILDLPCTFSMKALLAGDPFPYRWNPAHPARVGVIPHEGTPADVRWCEVDPCFVFHPANAYEADDGCIVFDACVHDRMFDDGAVGPDSRAVPFERWTIDPAARRVSRRVIDPAPQEFPRPDERFLGQPYRYAFTVALPDGGDPAFVAQSRLFRHDLVAGTREVHDFGPGRVPGEFVFVPRAPDAPEGDGWLMGYVIDTRAQTSAFVILDAARFIAPPVASVHIPHRIPPGFHGNWIAAG